MSQEIYNKVIEIIAEQFNEQAENLTTETRFKEDLHADSISVVELIMAFEDAFGQTIDDEVAEKIQTVGDVVDLITSKS